MTSVDVPQEAPINGHNSNPEVAALQPVSFEVIAEHLRPLSIDLETHWTATEQIKGAAADGLQAINDSVFEASYGKYLAASVDNRQMRRLKQGGKVSPGNDKPIEGLSLMLRSSIREAAFAGSPSSPNYEGYELIRGALRNDIMDCIVPNVEYTDKELAPDVKLTDQVLTNTTNALIPHYTEIYATAPGLTFVAADFARQSYDNLVSLNDWLDKMSHGLADQDFHAFLHVLACDLLDSEAERSMLQLTLNEVTERVVVTSHEEFIDGLLSGTANEDMAEAKDLVDFAIQMQVKLDPDVDLNLFRKAMATEHFNWPTGLRKAYERFTARKVKLQADRMRDLLEPHLRKGRQTPTVQRVADLITLEKSIIRSRSQQAPVGKAAKGGHNKTKVKGSRYTPPARKLLE